MQPRVVRRSASARAALAALRRALYVARPLTPPPAARAGDGRAHHGAAAGDRRWRAPEPRCASAAAPCSPFRRLAPTLTPFALLAPADGPSTSAGRRDAALAAYGALKAELLKNTGGVGLSLAAYLSLSQHDGAVGASALLGAAGGVAYMALLQRHVDVMGTPGHAVRGLPKKANPGENLGALFLSAVSRVGDIYWCVHGCVARGVGG